MLIMSLLMESFDLYFSRSEILVWQPSFFRFSNFTIRLQILSQDMHFVNSLYRVLTSSRLFVPFLKKEFPLMHSLHVITV